VNGATVKRSGFEPRDYAPQRSNREDRECVQNARTPGHDPEFQSVWACPGRSSLLPQRSLLAGLLRYERRNHGSPRRSRVPWTGVSPRAIRGSKGRCRRSVGVLYERPYSLGKASITETGEAVAVIFDIVKPADSRSVRYSFSVLSSPSGGNNIITMSKFLAIDGSLPSGTTISTINSRAFGAVARRILRSIRSDISSFQSWMM